MADVTLEYNEVASIPITVAADLTGKTVVFTVAKGYGGARVLRKTSAGGGGITLTQTTPTGIGTVAIAEADFGSGLLEAPTEAQAIAGTTQRTYYYALWYEDTAGGTNPTHLAQGKLIVNGTVARTANA